MSANSDRLVIGVGDHNCDAHFLYRTAIERGKRRKETLDRAHRDRGLIWRRHLSLYHERNNRGDDARLRSVSRRRRQRKVGQVLQSVAKDDTVHLPRNATGGETVCR